MANERNEDYEIGYVQGTERERRMWEERTARARQRSHGSSAPYAIIGFLCVIILLGLGLLRYRPDFFTAGIDTPATTPPPRIYPTLGTAGLTQAQQRADQTAAEQQALRNALPTEDTSLPPLAPAEADTRALNQGGIATTVPATSFSPSDLGNRPVPTPTTMLTQEQFDASQASEEQNQLNTAASGLTPAQQMVQVHEAEGNAQP